MFMRLPKKEREKNMLQRCCPCKVNLVVATKQEKERESSVQIAETRHSPQLDSCRDGIIQWYHSTGSGTLHCTAMVALNSGNIKLAQVHCTAVVALN